MTTRTWTIDVKVVEIRTVTVTVDDQFEDMLQTAYEDAQETVSSRHEAGTLRSRTVEYVPASHNLIREVIESDEENET